ncbi:MAG: OmpA family protein [Pseudomonadales bacterium]|jgi:outer membrane protein OmpA-like peptidoglycan-associated protein|nr:OmpA family protein [Pseudomonadales bacterium]
MKTPSLLRSGLLALALCASSAVSFSAFAADKEGCKDIPDIKRFQGSEIYDCATKNFDEYILLTGPADREIGEKLELAGKIIQNAYRAPPQSTVAEVFLNYRNQLESSGFQILYQGKNDLTGARELGFNFSDYIGKQGPGAGGGLGIANVRYVAAVKEESGAKTYLAVLVGDPGEKGTNYVRLDAIYIGTLQDKMVTVTADEMSQSMSASGKVALYGILFDTNQSAIKPESRPALDEIAKFLEANPNQKIYVIGHTDNVGGFDSNMQLSQARAAAVVAELGKTYGIAANRMKGAGAGLMAPVASNADEAGRAKNRRVELLPQ